MGRFFDFTVTIDDTDVSQLVKAGGSIDYGRNTVSDGFSSPRAVFTMHTATSWPEYAGDFPTLDEGLPVLIHTTWDGTTQWRRFTGVIQALDYSAPDGIQVTCAGLSVDLDTIVVGDTYPVPPTPPDVEIEIEPEPDVATGGYDEGRVDRFVEEAQGQWSGLTVNVIGTAGRFLNKIPHHTPGQPFLQAMLDMASWCDGLFRETRLGDFDYLARVRTRPSRYTLPEDVVERDTIDLSLERGWIRNAVYVTYGDIDPDTGSPRRVFSSNPTDITARGIRYGDEITTGLRFAVGAQGKGATWLENNQKAWHAPDVTLIMSATTDEEADEILGIDEADPVRVTPLPDGCPITTLDADVVGFTEIMHQEDYRIILHLAPGTPAGDEDDGNWITDGLITGWESGTYVQGGLAWRYHRLTEGTDDLVVADGVSVIGKLLVQGPGAAGGHIPGDGTGGGGGGAGEAYYGRYLILPGTFTGTVGTGGLEDVAYGDRDPSTFDDIVAVPGGLGGNRDATAEDGGSGGGAAGGSSSLPGSRIAGTGGFDRYHRGSDGVDDTATYGSPGGGASGTGKDGVTLDLTGEGDVEYGRGGDGGDGSSTLTPGSGGRGSKYVVHGADPGQDGVVILTYRISPGTEVAELITYDDPGLTYDDPDTTYEELYRYV
jgi:hypothetical protein